MAFSDFHACVVNFGVGCVCLVLNLTSLVTPFWMTLTFGDILPDRNIGLFKSCTADDDCSDLKGNLGDLKVVRAMVISTTGYISLALVLTVVSALCIWTQRLSRFIVNIFFIVAVVAYFLAFVFSMVAIGVYKDSIYDEYATQKPIEKCLNYSFSLCVVTGVLSVMPALVFIYSVCRSPTYGYKSMS